MELLSEPFYSSEFRSIVSGDIGWEIGRWTASIHGISYGRTPNYSAQIDTLGYGAPCDLNQLCPGRIGAYTVYNGSLKYEFSKDLSLSLIGNNLRNSEPPNDSTYTAYPFYNIFNYNGYQRSYWLELNWRFGAGN